ncbi:MAG TPA: tetratricopeptide repeat protein [Terracidiphilus sp.]|jgi:tetratricopeptide (TPR) repeat protein|nr:tetratricopeptide repeat protein [Terracidiphilus sp.]
MKWNRKYCWPMAWMAASALAAPSVVVVGQPPAAIQQATPAAATPQFEPTPEQVADSMMAHQRYQAAIEEYRKVSPETVDALNKMGVAYQLMFNPGDAAHCYQEALKLDPKNAVAFNNMGAIYMGQKEYWTAERTYRKAVKLDPHSALFRKNLGTALLAERKYKKGWQAYQDALAIDPSVFDHNSNVRVENPSSVQDRGAMNFYMAKGCLKAGMTERAIFYLRMALNEGFTTPKKILADAEFAGLRQNVEFQQMLAAQGVYLTDTSAHSTVRQ